jgi:hypothetical protein
LKPQSTSPDLKSTSDPKLQTLSSINSPKLKPPTTEAIKILNKTRFDILSKTPQNTPNTTQKLNPTKSPKKPMPVIDFIKLKDSTVPENVNISSLTNIDLSLNYLIETKTILKEYLYDLNNDNINSHNLLLPNYPLDPTSLVLVPKKQFISDIDMKAKLESLNKVLYNETVKNFIKMSESDNLTQKEINNIIKNNLLVIADVIKRDLEKFI